MVFVNEFLIERIKHFSVSINNDMQLLIRLSKTDLKRIWIYVLEISSTLLPAILLSARVFNDRNFNTLPLNNEHSLCFIFLNLCSLFLEHFCFVFLRSMIYLELLPESQDSLEDQVKFWGPSFANITFTVTIQD